MERRALFLGGQAIGDCGLTGGLNWERRLPIRKAETTNTRRTETVRGATYRYTVQFEPAEEGDYIVKVPALKGIATQRETLEEARAMAEQKEWSPRR